MTGVERICWGVFWLVGLCFLFVCFSQSPCKCWRAWSDSTRVLWKLASSSSRARRFAKPRLQPVAAQRSPPSSSRYVKLLLARSLCGQRGVVPAVRCAQRRVPAAGFTAGLLPAFPAAPSRGHCSRRDGGSARAHRCNASVTHKKSKTTETL